MCAAVAAPVSISIGISMATPGTMAVLARVAGPGTRQEWAEHHDAQLDDHHDADHDGHDQRQHNGDLDAVHHADHEPHQHGHHHADDDLVLHPQAGVLRLLAS